MMTDYKYLGVGLAGGVGVAMLFLGGALFFGAEPSASAATPTLSSVPSVAGSRLLQPAAAATSTQTALPPVTPQPTIVLTPTATLTHIDYMLESGQLIFPGRLAEETQIRLYEASVRYIALTPLDSLEMAKRINGVEYGNPANTCGPLAIAIMRDAGLVREDTNPHDFWLLNPWLDDDRRRLSAALTPENFSNLKFHTWLNKFDWSEFPLQPGDFLYIKAGGGGNFDHMLVVSRVDRRRRAYAVTNYQKPEGFVIDELLLYDPADPDAGLFAAWMAHPNAQLGSTGFGGFELWRPKVR